MTASAKRSFPSRSSSTWVTIPDSACSCVAASTTTAGAGLSSTTSTWLSGPGVFPPDRPGTEQMH